MSTPTTRLEVDRTIAAEPAAIFDLLRSPDGHVAIDATGMLMSADGDPATAVGDRFVVHMDRDSLRDFDLGEYDVTVVIETFEPNRRSPGASTARCSHRWGTCTGIDSSRSTAGRW